MKPRFWKLSQGDSSDFSSQDILDSIEQRLVYVHGNTKALGTSSTTQGEEFVNSPIGDYFYLTHGNKGIYLLGQFSGPPNIFSALGRGWVDRPFRYILGAVEIKPYTGPDKWWAPNHNSTFWAVPEEELGLFEETILVPHFGTRLSEFGVSNA
jgi:5-methylcytosine-specific restriction protein B